jgi:hypothetical protein
MIGLFHVLCVGPCRVNVVCHSVSLTYVLILTVGHCIYCKSPLARDASSFCLIICYVEVDYSVAVRQEITLTSVINAFVYVS